MDHPLRVLIVDDTVTYRKIVADVLAGCPDVEVVGTAANGKIALQRLDQQAAELLVLDLEMPEMNGQAVLEELRRRNSPTGAIMLSAFTAQGAKATLAALESGAFDFVLKPCGTNLEANQEQLRRELRNKLAAYARRRRVKHILSGGSSPLGNRAAAADPPPRILAAARPAASRGLGDFHRRSQGPDRDAAAVAGQSARAAADRAAHAAGLHQIAGRRPERPHAAGRPRGRRRPADPRGEIWIAPGGRQMKVQRENDQVVLRITDDPPENSCRPSVDYLFRSVAEVYGGRAVGVIMTGMGNDGSLGCRRLKHCGASIIAQDAATCVVFGMPREAIEKGIADVVVPLGRIAAEIVQCTRRGAAPCK